MPPKNTIRESSTLVLVVTNTNVAYVPIWRDTSVDDIRTRSNRPVQN